jgi:hypothetical protein
LAEQERQHLEPYLRDDPVAPRPTADYQHLLTPEACSHGPPSPTARANDTATDADAAPGPA